MDRSATIGSGAEVRDTGYHWLQLKLPSLDVTTVDVKKQEIGRETVTKLSPKRGITLRDVDSNRERGGGGHTAPMDIPLKLRFHVGGV